MGDIVPGCCCGILGGGGRRDFWTSPLGAPLKEGAGEGWGPIPRSCHTSPAACGGVGGLERQPAPAHARAQTFSHTLFPLCAPVSLPWCPLHAPGPDPVSDNPLCCQQYQAPGLATLKESTPLQIAHV